VIDKAEGKNKERNGIKVIISQLREIMRMFYVGIVMYNAMYTCRIQEYKNGR
jgi:hypothetical protein